MNIRPLAEEERDQVIASGLGLARLPRDDGSFYLVAWDGDAPAGHAHLALTDPPEVQDVEVLPEHRGRGIGTALVEAAGREAAARGFDLLTITVSTAKPQVQALYERAGFRDAGAPLKRVTGTVLIRTGPLEVDDTLRTLSISLNPVRRTSDTDPRRDT
ncbi:MAG TPA: GNAT family N-acetyltransferase [Gaiellaceae bacterium]|nr:GNAT family N-acetyltransferase [Gaiellaceae bacterium]